MSTSWQQRILDLEQTGLSVTLIAERVGLAKSTISGIKTGASKAPTGDAAIALFLLHRRICCRKREPEDLRRAPTEHSTELATSEPDASAA